MWHIGATPVSKLGGASSLILGSQVSLRVHYCKRDEVYFTTLRQQNNGRQNGLISRMLFSDLGKIMVNKVPFVGLRGGRSPPWTCPWCGMYHIIYIVWQNVFIQWCRRRGCRECKRTPKSFDLLKIRAKSLKIRAKSLKIWAKSLKIWAKSLKIRTKALYM